MKTWLIPVVWEERGVIEVDANTLAEAIHLADEKDGEDAGSGEYVKGSWKVEDVSENYMRMYLNDGQEDEKEVLTEAVEMCPYCVAENVYPMWDVKKKGYTATCKACGNEIFLCDECLHADDNPEQSCDWHETENGAKCKRGVHLHVAERTDLNG